MQTCDYFHRLAGPASRRPGSRVGWVFLIVLQAGPAHAETGPPNTPDAQTLGQGSDRTQRIKDAWKKFEQISEDKWRVHWARKTGLPRMIFGGRAGPYPGPPEQAARTFLDAHKLLFALDHEDRGLKLNTVRPVGAGEVRVEFQLQYRGMDVYHATIRIFLDPAGHVGSITSTAWPVHDLDITPRLSVDEIKALLVNKPGAVQPVIITQGPALTIYPEGKGRLAYLVYLTVGPGNTPFEYVLDAHTGAVIRSTKLIKNGKAQNASSSSGGAKRVSRGPVSQRSALRRVALDPCDRVWQLNGPGGETSVTEKGAPADPFEVDIQVGIPAFGIAEDGNQTFAIYGAGMKLLPCKEYTVLFKYDLSTWDSYNSIPVDEFGGFWDVFAVTVNSDDFYWNNATAAPIGDLSCSTTYLQNAVYPLGNTWMFGGYIWDDGILCGALGSFTFTYEETDSAKNPYLSVLLDTGVTGDVDGFYPSWGTFNLELLSETQAFNPNPYRGDPDPDDENDADKGVACGAYFDITLANFVGQPEGDDFWRLTGDYVIIRSLPNEPPLIDPAKWRNSTFPFTRSCDEFEDLMCYYHITQNQLYIQSLGFNNINNRQHVVDAHGFCDTPPGCCDGNCDNSYYSPEGCPGDAPGDPPFGCGYLAFGPGGVDDAEDADIILHEYGHSIQDNQAPGVYFGTGGFGFGDETGAMGEGFGDYWACSTFAVAVVDKAAMGEWDAQRAKGLRRVDGELQPDGSVKTEYYPRDMHDQVHDDGEIWSYTLWKLFNEHGKEVADKLVLDSHRRVPDDPTFADGAVALLAADHERYTDAHQESIISIYLDRGIFRKLDVTSNDVGVPITLTPDDVRGDGNGNTSFQRAYPYCRDLPGTPCQGVNLEAPATSPSGAGFVRWVVDGVNQPAGQRIVNVTMDHAPAVHAARALYDVGTEACCFPNGTCANLAPGDCSAAGGAAQGAGTICLGDFDGNGIDDACEPPEACCFIDGSCANLGTGLCSFIGGVSQGVGTACLGDFDGNGIDDACEIDEACCFPNGTCANLGSGSCGSAGGAAQGVGTTCLGDTDGNGVDDACESPEACCFPDGSCADIAQGLCLFLTGAPQGPGSFCLGDFDGNGIDDACEITEACCFPDGTCADLGSGNCASAGGAAQGVGTACLGDSDGNGVDDACEAPQACCFPGGTCADIAPDLCLFLTGAPQGPGSVCQGDTDGNGVDDACETPQACCFPNGTCANLGSGNCASAGGTAQGVGTECLGDTDGNGVDDACESPEACCFPGGTCADMAPDLCVFLTGAPQGPGSFCRGDFDSNGVDDACEPLEPCCLASGVCIAAGTGDCAFFDGVSQGVGTVCLDDYDGNGIDDLCEIAEACCFSDGSCTDLGTGDCAFFGGASQGVGTACQGDTDGNGFDDACEAPQACCFLDGTCTDTGPGLCLSLTGAPQGPGSFCRGDFDGNGVDDACELLEACCLASGVCVDAGTGDCAFFDGVAQGVGTACLGDFDGNGIDDICEIAEACCFSDGSCTDLGTGDCAFFSGASQGVGTACQGDTDGNGVDDVCELICGNGSVDPGEECDGGLGCTDCLCDADFEPTAPPSLDCQPTCGNGSVDPGEECDGGLGCTDCLCDADFEPTTPPSLDCQPICGNGSVDPGEECDGGLGCTDCLCDAGFEPTTPPSLDCQATCGNGSLDPGEECDGGLGCTDCLCDAGFELTAPPSLDCRPLCGNGSLDPGEECDGGLGCTDCLCDANFEPTAPPSLDCQPICGNNVAEPDEECDGTDDAACPGLCRGNCTCPPPAGGIPTVSEWGLIILTLLGMTAGTIMLGRRRAATRAR